MACTRSAPSCTSPLFLDVRNAAAILDHTSLHDLLERDRRLLAARARGGQAKTRR